MESSELFSCSKMVYLLEKNTNEIWPTFKKFQFKKSLQQKSKCTFSLIIIKIFVYFNYFEIS
jgi:hypothetical protein